MIGGEAVVKSLYELGCRLVFGIPGTHNLAIYEGLRKTPEIRHILARNEQSAGYMANGFGRVKGIPGVAIVTTGPAAANILASVGDAYRDRVPLLIIASQIPRDYIGTERGIFHEMVDQAGMFSSAGAAVFKAQEPGDIPRAVRSAYEASIEGCPRPTYLEVPQDVLHEEFTDDGWKTERSGKSPGVASLNNEYSGKLEETRAFLAKAERPLILAGAGASRSEVRNGTAAVRRLGETFNVPVFTTVHGKGVIPEDHPLSAGVLLPWLQETRDLCKKTDFLLALGTGFNQRSTDNWKLVLPKKLIQVDINDTAIGKNYPVRFGMKGDIHEVTEQLLGGDKSELGKTEVVPPERQDWISEALGIKNEIQKKTDREPGMDFFKGLRRLLPRDTVIVGDAQSWGYRIINHFPVYSADSFAYPINFGTLGFSIPAAMGIQAAFPKRRVAAFVGDGGFLFSSNELATAVQHSLPVVIFLGNDNAYGSIRFLQEKQFGADYQAELKNPDFIQYARSFGCLAVRAEGPEDLEKVSSLLVAQGNIPLLIEMDFEIPRLPYEPV